MNCLKRLPRSAGEYRADIEYLPQDRVLCDGSIYASLRAQTGNKPEVTVFEDGSYTVTDGWMLLALGANVPGGGQPLVGNPSINGVELVGDRTSAELGLVGSSSVHTVAVLTEDAYAALPEKDPATLYVITKGDGGDED